ncbi:hypothetical protein L3Y34_000541 [Caenorhabditis briggsae]|uniref:Uncharacterized protein n=1 Tax=Caenorhabditis briggsae TaxID=6238 RepID=A0AAE9D9W0_CAEBR|nr:hypothetical protein L3Y34_000541 [Caenorhabditis briggsae]
MSKPLNYDMWPPVMQYMDLGNRTLLSLKYPKIRLTDKRCPARVERIHVTEMGVKVNDTKFIVKKYESGEYMETSGSDSDPSRTIILKTEVPVSQAKQQLFLAFFHRKLDINTLILDREFRREDVSWPSDLKIKIRNLWVSPYQSHFETYANTVLETRDFLNEINGILSHPLESMDLGTCVLMSHSVTNSAKTLLVHKYAHGIEECGSHRIHVQNTRTHFLEPVRIVEKWQLTKPEVGRHFSLATDNLSWAQWVFRTIEMRPDAHVTFALSTDVISYGITFPIGNGKEINVFVTSSKKGSEYVLNFKIDGTNQSVSL